MPRSSVSVISNVPSLSRQIRRRTVERVDEATLHLASAARETLSGARSGRRYRIPGTKARRRRLKSGRSRRGPAKKYTASAANEPPAVRLGQLRASVATSPARLAPGARAAIGRVGSRGLRPAYGRILELRRKHARPWLGPTFARERQRVQAILARGWNLATR